ncbi:ATP-binding cassette domain-containing protein [Kineosporia sp. A_224]|uniref:ATP-binding cassette domain-containing protein n=1 Tax=Kineosporia sp. A_224 TaxID=1962180 RepID=UPI000B4BA72F|nr:ATP-binding cassette domain-containing protein [Kineosporia sp. A_224]
MSTPTAAIEAVGLVKRFGSTTALDGVDLHAPAGTVLGVLGPNGAGKTTAVRILATLSRPDAGHARVAGLDVVRDAAAVRRTIGLTGQYASVDEDLTGTENLVLIGRLLDLSRRDARARAAVLIARFGLDDAGGRTVKTYSGGMRRRLDLAAGLMGHPTVIFLDEPTTGLDPGKRDDVWRLVRGLADDGVTVLLTTQYLEEADALADHLTVVDHGRVIANGTPAELKATIGSRSVDVRPRLASDIDTVRGVLAEVSGRGLSAVETIGRHVASVPVDSDDAVTAVVSRLATLGVAVDELALRRPTLDEVFFSLTGSRTDDSGSDDSTTDDSTDTLEEVPA